MKPGDAQNPGAVFVFGSQYLRGMTPPRDDWSRDMEAMRAAGFNTIRAWLVWGVLERRQGEFDYAYLDEFLALAQQHGLSAGLLFHLHGCPEWAVRRFSRYWYVDSRGLPFEPSQRSNTPSGGWPGLCPDHSEVRELEARFIESITAHVGNHPALAFWEPINEPHMWVDMAADPPGPFCYCPATRAAFIQWLRERYGKLEALETAWGRRFGQWEDVRPPTWAFGYSDWVDWRTFTAENIAALVARRTSLIKRHSAAPVIAHAWGGGCVTCQQLGSMAFDDWKNAAPVDKWGYSAFPTSAGQTVMVGLGTDATRGASGDREFWQSELGAGDYGSGFGRGGRIRPEVEAMFCWESIRHGAKGLLFWQYRKEAHGSEIGAFGLTDYGGNETELLASVSAVGKVLTANAELFHAVQVRPAPVALLFSFRTYMADWAAHRNCRLSVDCLSGYYKAFWDRNIPVDILHEETLQADTLARYRMVVLPNPAALCEEARGPLAEYVQAGGTLLSDPYLCGFNPDLSLPQEVPGGGFSPVFGCREVDITRPGDRVVELRMGDRTIPVSGSHFMAWWEPLEGAEVVAHYPDGRAALVRNRRGSGTAIISGLNLGLACSIRQGVGDDFVRDGRPEQGPGNAAELVLELARQAGVEPEIDTPPEVRASLLSASDGRHVLIAINTADESRSGAIRLSGVAPAYACDLTSGAQCSITAGGELALEFQPYQSKMLLLKE